MIAAHPVLAVVPSPLRDRAEHGELGQGEALFRIGDRVQNLYFVATGEVHLRRLARDGAEIVLQRSRNGFLAEASLGARTYHCDALAARTARVLCFPACAFQAALDDDVDFRRIWMRLLAREVRKVRAQCERLNLRSAADRICHYLESEGSDGVVILEQSRKAWAC